MELIYMYIGNTKFSLKNQGIIFGKQFYVNYDPATKKLEVEKHVDEMTSIYGNHIKSLDLLIGKNGTGKTTMLNILGLPKVCRHDLMPAVENGYKSDVRWFVLYHVKEDLFVAEGYYADVFNFIPSKLEDSLRPPFSIAFRYDFENHIPNKEASLVQAKFANDGVRSVNQEAFYVFYESDDFRGWYKRPYRTPTEDNVDDVICQRIYADHVGFEGLEKYLYASIHESFFSQKMASKPGTKIVLSISRGKRPDIGDNPEILDYDVENTVARFIYCEDMKLVEIPYSIFPKEKQKGKFTIRQAMALQYLEEVVFDQINQREFYQTGTYAGEDTYEGRKKYLFTRLKEMNVNTNDQWLSGEIIDHIEKIPESFFNEKGEAIISISDMQENFLSSLMRDFDCCRKETCLDVNHLRYLSIKFVGISSGEAKYLELYASLYNALIDKKRKGDTCILLLDEPDSRFHPEWSRNFIFNIVKQLQKDIFSDYYFQIIISTHSPFLVSDVPRESIHCFYRDPKTDQICIGKSDYGFLSNINDLITDSFYCESVFGSFSEKYTNDLISELSALEIDCLRRRVNLDEIKRLEEKLDVICNPIIYESLKKRLNRLKIRSESIKND